MRYLTVICFIFFYTALISLDTVKSQSELNSRYLKSISKRDSMLAKSHSKLDIVSLSELNFNSHYKYWKSNPYSYPSLSFSLGEMYDYGNNGLSRVTDNFNGQNINIVSIKIHFVDIFNYELIDYYLCQSGLGGDGPYDLIIEESVEIIPENTLYEIFNRDNNPIVYKFPESTEQTLTLQSDRFYTFRFIFENSTNRNLAFIYFIEFETKNTIFYSDNFIYSFNDKKPFSELYKKELPSQISYNFDNEIDDNSEFYEFLGNEFGYGNVSKMYINEEQDKHSKSFIRFDQKVEFLFDQENIINSRMMKYITATKNLLDDSKNKSSNAIEGEGE